MAEEDGWVWHCSYKNRAFAERIVERLQKQEYEAKIIIQDSEHPYRVMKRPRQAVVISEKKQISQPNILPFSWVKM